MLWWVARVIVYDEVCGGGFSVNAYDGNPEPDLVHATGCKQPTLRSPKQL
jgi:hypothetical protein